VPVLNRLVVLASFKYSEYCNEDALELTGMQTHTP
jgi:hypothetical protein